MNVLYLITARGGSKGVPDKNIRPLGGLPLLVYSVRTALSVAPDSRDVVVSTDSERIADIGRREGARVPFMRPAHLASDSASSRDVIIHALESLRHENNGEGYDTVVLLQPTSPFRNPRDIEEALRIFEKERPDMVVSVKPAATNPYYNAYETRPDGTLGISKGEGRFTRRQDAPPVWEFDGSIYVIDADALRRHPSMGRMPRILPIENTDPHNIDIDTELDFLLAEKSLEFRV